jgi:nicotinate-nucleotide pyrophosphorylase (carboxylating)
MRESRAGRARRRPVRRPPRASFRYEDRGPFPFKQKIDAAWLKKVIGEALREDAARDDVATRLVVAGDARAAAALVLKDDGVVAGLAVFRTVFASFDPSTRVALEVEDGMWCARGTVLARVSGRARSILSCERVALNFVQRMSGVATATRRFVEKVSGTGVRILDTRKTTPTLRALDKYAVTVGGGFNHRPDLAGLALIKDNHIVAAGGPSRALSLAAKARPRVLVEIEVGPEADLEGLGNLPVDILMLDNWPLKRLPGAVRAARRLPSQPLIEISGRVSLANVRRLAECGPDFISVGCVTHSAPALDLSLDFEVR